MDELTPFEQGVFVGVIIGEGSFGGDGRQPQITLRMHTRHEALFHWLIDRFPSTKLYGPYHHGERSYYQWMARGPALVNDVLPLLEAALTEGLDEHASSRLAAMTSKYSGYIARTRARASDDAAGEAGSVNVDLAEALDATGGTDAAPAVDGHLPTEREADDA
ncbi:MAG TPA: hypothetical protein VGM91_18625 [Conexibacter sp.]|jgi:hypothetical protein